MRTWLLRAWFVTLVAIDHMLLSNGVVSGSPFSIQCGSRFGSFSIRGGGGCVIEDRRSGFQSPHSLLEQSIMQQHAFSSADLSPLLRSPPSPTTPTPMPSPNIPPAEPVAIHLQLEGVREPLVRALQEAGVVALTPIQVAALPHCLAGADLLAHAKTGTGKTLAFLIPTVERVLRAGPPQRIDGLHDPIRALVLSPTRELATQIAAQAERLLAFVPAFLVESVLGGGSIVPQRERLDPAASGGVPGVPGGAHPDRPPPPPPPPGRTS